MAGADRIEDRRLAIEAFLIFAHDVVETLRDGTGWEVEYPRDIWRLHTLARPDPQRRQGARTPATICGSTGSPSPGCGRWPNAGPGCGCRCGLSVGTVHQRHAGLTRFSTFLGRGRPRGRRAGRDRPAAAGTLPGLAGHPARRARREGGRRHRRCTCSSRRSASTAGTTRLPTTAVFFPGDTPPARPGSPAALAEHVMAQVEAPANLDRWPHPEGRLITMILIRCGLRASDACTLAFDCLLHDGQGAALPALPQQQDAPRGRRPDRRRTRSRDPRPATAGSPPAGPTQHPHLFPAATRNAGGRRPDDLLQLPQHAQPLADRLRRPRRARPSRST